MMCPGWLAEVTVGSLVAGCLFLAPVVLWFVFIVCSSLRADRAVSSQPHDKAPVLSKTAKRRAIGSPWVMGDEIIYRLVSMEHTKGRWVVQIHVTNMGQAHCTLHLLQVQFKWPHWVGHSDDAGLELDPGQSAFVECEESYGDTSESAPSRKPPAITLTVSGQDGVTSHFQLAARDA